MPGLWRNEEGTREGKYLVRRRDGTVPEWPWFVLGAKDPASPAALRSYAVEARRRGIDPVYCDEVEAMADEFETFRIINGNGDPDAPRHREDDPETVAAMGITPRRTENGT